MREPILPAGEARRALLADHLRLRRLLAELEDLADRVSTDDQIAARFQAVAAQFRNALGAHNAAEEEALEPLLLPLGGERLGEMRREHAAEHRALAVAFGERDARTLAGAVPGLAREVRDHMQHEESTFLAAGGLGDEPVRPA
jgi:hemerythrin-like domain-containing protein